MTDVMTTTEEDQQPGVLLRPGALAGDVSVDIHTLQAFMLVKVLPAGQTKPTPGILLNFAGHMMKLWNASSRDDPFADWYMEEAQSSIMSASKRIRETQERMDSAIRNCGMNVDLPYAKITVKIPMTFGAPYGFMGARLVMACDKAIRSVLSERHIGLISTSDADKDIEGIIATVKQALKGQFKYRHKGVTREDAKQKNAKFNEAAEIMGFPPEDIINGRRPEFSPRIRKESDPLSEL